MAAPRSRFLRSELSSKTPWCRRKRAVLAELKHVGKLLYLVGAFRVHVDGDGITPVWRWFHPVSWIVFLLAIPFCAVAGEKITDAIPFRLNKYWRRPQNFRNLEWL